MLTAVLALSPCPHKIFTQSRYEVILGQPPSYIYFTIIFIVLNVFGILADIALEKKGAGTGTYTKKLDRPISFC